MSEVNYFNTTGESGENLKKYIDSARSQQKEILEHFRKHPGRNFSPHQIWQTLFDDRTPQTSVRRAISNLTKMGFIEKTPEMHPGAYGRRTHSWRLRTN